MSLPCFSQGIDLTHDFSSEVSLSPTRMKQSIRDLPATLTILHRENLLSKGITSIPEALRLVPGMSVIEVSSHGVSSGRDYRIGYHGGSSMVPRRLQVMVDGMSVYLAGLAKIDWAQLHISIEDIERIEVIRNPSSATYGANSFNAVINIITKHPDDSDRNYYSASYDTRDNFNVEYVHAGDHERFTYLLRARSEGNKGYDFETSNVNPDYSPNNARDDYIINKASFRVESLIGYDQLSISGAYVDGKYQTEYVSDGQIEPFPDLDIEDAHLNSSYITRLSSSAELNIQAYYRQTTLDQDIRACEQAALLLPETRELALSNRSYAETILAGGTPSGGSTEDDILALQLLSRIQQLGPAAFDLHCGTINQDYVDKKSYVEIEYKNILSESLQIVAGGSFEYNQNTSETYFNGSVSDKNSTLFFSTEWKPKKYLTVNFGGLLENSSNAGETKFNPRGSLNYHLSPLTTIRFVASRSYRTPDLAETARDWSYLARDLEPALLESYEAFLPFRSSSDNFNLTSERIDAFEIGLLHNSKVNKYSIDGRVFKEKLNNLISEKLAWSTFNLTNENETDVTGLEISSQYRFSNAFSFDLGYSYQDHDISSLNESGFNSNHSGSLFFVYNDNGLVSSFGYVGYSNLPNDSLDIFSFNISKEIDITNSVLEIGLLLKYQPSDIVYEEENIQLRNIFSYEDSISASLNAKWRF